MYSALTPIFKQLIAVLASISVVLGGLSGTVPKLGADNVLPAGLATYYLGGSGITSSATSFSLTSFTLPQNSYPIQDADLSDTFYLTFEPGNRTRQEFASCTTVGANTGSTVTISGCTRGLSPITPYTASSTLQFAHAGGSTIIFSNSPNLYSEFAARRNDESIYGTWTFSSTSPPAYDANVTASGNQFVSYTQLNATAIAGAGTSTESALGLVQLVSGSQVGGGTASSTSGAPLVLTNKYASSTYSGSQSNLLVATGATNKIDSNFIATSSSYTWSATHSFTGNVTTASTTATGRFITGTLVATGTSVTLGGVPYTVPSTQGASSTVLMNNGLGGLHWQLPDLSLVGSTTTTGAQSFATTTISSTVKNLRIYYYGAGMSASTDYALTFNGDANGNYASQSSVNNGTLWGYGAQPYIILFNSATTSIGYFVIDVTNISGTRKFVTWRGTLQNSGSEPPTMVEGSGIWNNTSSNITAVGMQTIDGASATLTIGSYLRVYALGD